MVEERKANLQHLFKPGSVAILGASADPNKVSGRPLAYMLRFGYTGKIYPINPKHEQIAGVKCYPSLEEIPDPIDLLMAIIPAREILPNLETGLKKGAKAAIIVSGGFAEVGEQGKKLQEQLTDFARRTGMLLYGPNTTGFLSLVHRTVVTFSQSLEVIPELLRGTTGLVTQSGAFGATIFVHAMRAGLGLSHWAATGNEADLEFCDFLDYMAEDPETRVIAGFLAGVADGQKLIRSLDRAAAQGKPVVLLKVGGTEAARRAAYSHTGAIVGSARVYDAVFQQKGVIVARDVPELIDYAMALGCTPLPKGNRVGILTESGGGGVLLTERCSEAGLEVGEIQGETCDRLQQVVPALGSVKNPVDLTGQSLSEPALVKNAVEVMLQSQDFEIIIPLLLMSETTAGKKATDLYDLLQVCGQGKTVVVCWPEGPVEWVRYLASRKIHVSPTATRCARTLGALASYAEFQRRQKAAASGDARAVTLPGDRRERALEVITRVAETGERRLNEHQAKKVLAAYAIPTAREQLCGSIDEAVHAAQHLGYPVAAKLLSPDIPHKTEAQVVALDIKSEEQLRRSCREILERGTAYRPGARFDGLLIQEMAPRTGVETIVGLSDEAPFGPAVLFGLGGIFVELLQDVAIRVPPITEADVEEMIRQIRGYPVLKGIRGRAPADTDALADILMKIGVMALELRDAIAEIDINPLIVLEKGRGAVAVDALMLLKAGVVTA
ncbi:MAG: acetate--CoA ligase family protein [Acidobacteria bacterium]|nr:acetate--CoA ligase family protein [Acidobacteriota bacterium]